MTDIIRADYERLGSIADRFTQQAAQISEMNQHILQSMEPLQNGGWIGEGASAFFAEMEATLLPANRRLSEAFEQANRTVQDIVALLKEAEDEAAEPFKQGEYAGMPTENGRSPDAGLGFAGGAPANGGGGSAPAEEKGFVDRAVDFLTDWHIDRNEENVLPKGNLVPKGNASPDFVHNPNGDNIYVDEDGREWRLVPDAESIFHQPEGHENSDNPFPNKKFLSRDGIGSHEAILQPDGTYVTSGPLQGTYNIVDPSGVIVGAKDAVVDGVGRLIDDPIGTLGDAAEAVQDGAERLVDDPLGTLGDAADGAVETAKDVARDIGHAVTDIAPHIVSDDYEEFDQTD